jgi:hypothetical protein
MNASLGTWLGSMRAARVAAVMFALATFAGCASNPPPEPEAASAPAPAPPPPPPPPPVDLAGRWRLTETGSGACFINFGNAPAAAQGTIAPEGGCPGNFFTSRKWTFEHDTLIIRNHKDEPLARLSFSSGHFEGSAAGGAAVSLSR